MSKLDDVVIDTIRITGTTYTKNGEEYNFSVDSSAVSDETLRSMFNDLDFRLFETLEDMKEKGASQCLTLQKVQ